MTKEADKVSRMGVVNDPTVVDGANLFPAVLNAALISQAVMANVIHSTGQFEVTSIPAKQATDKAKPPTSG